MCSGGQGIEGWEFQALSFQDYNPLCGHLGWGVLVDIAVGIRGRCMLTGWVQALRSDEDISEPANFRGWARPWLMGEVLSGGHGKAGWVWS